MDGAQVGVLEERHGVRLGGLLQRQEREGLEAEVGEVAVGSEAVGDLADKALEWPLADEEIGGLLIPADLSQGLRPWPGKGWAFQGWADTN